MGKTKKSCKPQAYILECGQHMAFLLPDSVRRRPDSARRCRACQQVGSRSWREALRIIQSEVQGLGPVAFECQLLDVQKRFDAYLRQHKLAIEFDGVQHFEGCYFGVSAEQQYKFDRKIDEECKKKGQRLVRLHHKDMREWASTVQKAISSQQVITYTSSYKLK